MAVLDHDHHDIPAGNGFIACANFCLVWVAIIGAAVLLSYLIGL